jgi:hypothetical protein
VTRVKGLPNLFVRISYPTPSTEICELVVSSISNHDMVQQQRRTENVLGLATSEEQNVITRRKLNQARVLGGIRGWNCEH